VTVRFRDLIAESHPHGTSMELRTSTRLYFVDATRFRNGSVDRFIGSTRKRLPPPDECGLIFIIVNGDRCDGFAVHWDADADLVRFSIPRVCLGNPEWVRGSAFSYRGSGRDVIGDQWRTPDESTALGPRVYAASEG
jgi:hypothetical protein